MVVGATELCQQNYLHFGGALGSSRTAVGESPNNDKQESRHIQKVSQSYGGIHIQIQMSLVELRWGNEVPLLLPILQLSSYSTNLASN